MYVDKSPSDIIEMHNPPTSNWEVVADDLGITQEELDEIHQKKQSTVLEKLERISILMSMLEMLQ